MNGAGSDQNRVHLATQLMSLLAGCLSCDPAGFSCTGRDFTIQSHSHLRRDKRRSCGNVFYEDFIELAAFSFEDTHGDLDPRFPQLMNPSASDQRIWVFYPRHYPIQTRGYERPGAGRGSPRVTARLKIHIESRSSCSLSSLPQGQYFCMLHARSLVTPATHNLPVADNDSTDKRIGICETQPLPGQCQSLSHEAFIVHRQKKPRRDQPSGRRTHVSVRTFSHRSSIQAFTVGSGISPDQSRQNRVPTRVAGYTAGREFHPAPKVVTLNKVLKNFYHARKYLSSCKMDCKMDSLDVAFGNRFLPPLFQGSMSCRQPGDGYTEGGTADVIQLQHVAKLNGTGFSTVLPTDTKL